MTTDALDRLTALACPKPVFIIGSPRSGTSVVPWALAHHGSFWTTRESSFFLELFPPGVLDRAFGAAHEVGWADELAVDRATFTASVGLGLNALLTSRSGGRRWIDQTPANTVIVHELAELFPGAQFLHMVRDGRRVVHSMQHFGRTLGADLKARGGLPEWATDFRTSVRTWCDFVTMALEFEAEHPDRCIRMRLEDIVADPPAGFQQLLDHLRESANTQPAAYFATQRINSSFGDAAGNADPTAVAREPDPFRSWASEDQQTFAEEGAAALLERLGYPPSSG